MCDLTSLKGTHLSVLVDEALPDIIVVSYVHDAHIFRGVLLDSSKRHLPCGVSQLNPAFNADKPDEDVLYAVKQRYAYTDPKYTHISPSSGPQQTRSLKNNKIGKMTVRLRPRQVLCSKCKDICNENSESITRKRKATDVEPPAPAAGNIPAIPQVAVVTSPAKRSANAPVTRSSSSQASHSLQVLSQAQSLQGPQTAQQKKQAGALSGIVNKLNIVNYKKALSLSNQSNENTSLGSDVQHDGDDKRLKRVILTRKKAVLISEKEKELEIAKASEFSQSTPTVGGSGSCLSGISTNGSNTRTIKICYGPQREGTVLKIPAAIEKIDTEDEDILEENVVEEEIASKATRKAMKKAKKAKKKITFQTLGSPEQSTSRYNPSSSYSIGSSSPRYTVGSASPRHGLGNNSPRFVATLPPIPLAAFEPLPKKRKHKMKHKKKHKEDRQDRDRKHKEDHGEIKDKDEDKEKCLTQKLSINLKRLSGTYTTSIVADATSTTSNRDGDFTHDDENDPIEMHGEDEDRENDDERDMGFMSMETSGVYHYDDIGGEDRDDDSAGEVPDFPPGPLRLKLTAKNLNSAVCAEGGQLIVGDVVWGKLQGFPWWPGKILTITNCDNGPRPQAHVSWYGSSTSSLIQCENLSPYLANFKARHNKKKRGPYKDAIKQATNEARVLAELKSAQVASSSPSSTTTGAATTSPSSASASPSRMIMLVQPALASPREINVIS